MVSSVTAVLVVEQEYQALSRNLQVTQQLSVRVLVCAFASVSLSLSLSLSVSLLFVSVS